jgi:hypothetical protein
MASSSTSIEHVPLSREKVTSVLATEATTCIDAPSMEWSQRGDQNTHEWAILSVEGLAEDLPPRCLIEALYGLPHVHQGREMVERLGQCDSNGDSENQAHWTYE